MYSITDTGQTRPAIWASSIWAAHHMRPTTLESWQLFITARIYFGPLPQKHVSDYSKLPNNVIEGFLPLECDFLSCQVIPTQPRENKSNMGGNWSTRTSRLQHSTTQRRVKPIHVLDLQSPSIVTFFSMTLGKSCKLLKVKKLIT